MNLERGVRAMQWTDLAGVAELEQRIHPDTAWREQTWWGELAGRPRRHYLVAESGEHFPFVEPEDRAALDDRRVVGFAGLDVHGDHADVMTIAVDPAHRGTGLGSALLRGLHQEAQSRHVSAVLLEVRADNERAQALYARHGYRMVHTRAGYYQPDGVDAIVLRAVLRGREGPVEAQEPGKNMLMNRTTQGGTG